LVTHPRSFGCGYAGAAIVAAQLDAIDIARLLLGNSAGSPAAGGDRVAALHFLAAHPE